VAIDAEIAETNHGEESKEKKMSHVGMLSLFATA
jgi:hypothetical protein